MPGNIIHGDAIITCPHGGRATVTNTTATKLNGAYVATGGDTFTITGCPNHPHPCATIQWDPEPGGVLIDGVPALFDTTPAQCFTATRVPTGTPRIDGTRHGIGSR